MSWTRNNNVNWWLKRNDRNRNAKWLARRFDRVRKCELVASTSPPLVGSPVVVLPRKRYPRAPICLRANAVFSQPFIPVCNPSLDDNKRGVYPCFPICHGAFSPNVFMMIFVCAAKLLVLPSAKTKIRHAFETRVFRHAQSVKHFNLKLATSFKSLHKTYWLV